MPFSFHLNFKFQGSVQPSQLLLKKKNLSIPVLRNSWSPGGPGRGRGGPSVSEGIHIFQYIAEILVPGGPYISEKLVPGGSILGGSKFNVTWPRFVL